MNEEQFKGVAKIVMGRPPRKRNKMRVLLLVSDEMKPVPNDVTIIADYGKVDIVSDAPEIYHSGDHMIVEGDEKAIRSWLGPYDAVWVGEGSPMLQQFQVMHIANPDNEQ
jgi:hypothetical protein